jgi:hypothetical protein
MVEIDQDPQTYICTQCNDYNFRVNNIQVVQKKVGAGLAAQLLGGFRRNLLIVSWVTQTTGCRRLLVHAVNFSIYTH